MACLAVFTSGNGSNFQAIAEYIKETKHTVVCMICDRKNAYSFERAKNLNIKSYYVSYVGRSKCQVEEEILSILEEENVNFIALAGFMRLLSPIFVNKYEKQIVNIHPSLLPKYPGTHGIPESFASEDIDLGITIHYVDTGIDTGEIIVQKSFSRDMTELLEEIEKKIHKLEYSFYPKTIENLLDSLKK